MGPNADRRRLRDRARAWAPRLGVVLAVAVALAGAGEATTTASPHGPIFMSQRTAEDAASDALAAALEVEPAALRDLVVVATPALPGLVGLALAVVDEGPRPTAVLAPLLACDPGRCVGEVRRYPGAAAIDLVAVVDLVGRGQTIAADAVADDRPASARGPAPRWPAAVIAVRFATEGDEEILHELVALRPPLLASLARAYSHVGPEGGLQLEALEIAATTGGGPGDLTLVRRRVGADGRPCAPSRERRLHIFLDERYTHAPSVADLTCP